jgi:MscS family membrane protein
MQGWMRSVRVWFGLVVMLGALAAPTWAQESSPTESSSAATSAAPPAAAVQAVVESRDKLDSPRAAMDAFLKAMNQWRVEHGQKGSSAWFNLRRTLEHEGMSDEQTLQAAIDLLDVLDKLGTIDVMTLPGTEVGLNSVNRYVFFPGPGQEFVWTELKGFGRWPADVPIVLVQTAGGWKFSRQTLAGIGALKQSMEPLPPRHLAPAPQPDEVGWVLSILGPTFQRTQWIQWLALLACIFLGLLAGKIVQTVLRRSADGLFKRNWQVRGTVLDNAAGPASLALLALGLAVGLGFIWKEDVVAGIARKAILFLYMFAVGWFAFNLVDLIDLALRRAAAKTANPLDDMVVPLVRKSLRIFMVIVFAIMVLQNVFELNITGFLASLGIAGLAISLAAQDSVKNLFGSLTVFFDRPFAVGQRIKFDAFDGIVEEIGFRSTRIRTLEGHLVTVPNMVFIDKTVENVALRPSIRRILDVTITYDTPPEKIRQAVQIIKDILAEPAFAEPFDMTLTPPRVAFDNFNADSLNIKVLYWYQLTDGRDYWGYLDHTERFNLRLFEAFAKAGIEFAFPTQTLYLAGDKARPLSVAVTPPQAKA